MLNKKLIISLMVIGSRISHATFNMTGGTVQGGTISGSINAKETTFNNVTFLNSKTNEINLLNCNTSGCVIKDVDGNSTPADSAATPSGPQAKAGSQGNGVGDGVGPKADSQGVGGSGSTHGSGKSGTAGSSNLSERNPHEPSGVIPLGRGIPQGKTGEFYDGNGDFQGSFFESSENRLRPGEDAVKTRNMQNAADQKEWLRQNNPYSMRESFDPNTLRPRSELPQIKDNVPGTLVGDPMFLDPQMGALTMKGDVLFDRWGNRMGTLKYDSEYKRKHGTSGSNYLHFDEDYKIAGTVIVPKGYYKNMGTGDIYDPSGKKWGEMTNDGTIFGVPSLIVEKIASTPRLRHDELP